MCKCDFAIVVIKFKTKNTTETQDEMVLKFKQDAEECYNQNAIETTTVIPNNRIHLYMRSLKPWKE